MNEEIKLNEVSVTKLNLSLGDVLIAYIKSDELDAESMNGLGEMLRKAFPGNKVIVMGTGSEGSVNFTVAKDVTLGDTKVIGCGTTPNSFCSDCSCGKKEAYEKGVNNGNW